MCMHLYTHTQSRERLHQSWGCGHPDNRCLHSLCPGSPRARGGQACIKQRADHTPQVLSTWGCFKCIHLYKKPPHSGLFCWKPAQLICKTVRNKVFEQDSVKREASYSLSPKVFHPWYMIGPGPQVLPCLVTDTLVLGRRCICFPSWPRA